jgi:hypothetical protein
MKPTVYSFTPYGAHLETHLNQNPYQLLILTWSTNWRVHKGFSSSLFVGFWVFFEWAFLEAFFPN